VATANVFCTLTNRTVSELVVSLKTAREEQTFSQATASFEVVVEKMEHTTIFILS
jgi:hypothetical protein